MTIVAALLSLITFGLVVSFYLFIFYFAAKAAKRTRFFSRIFALIATLISLAYGVWNANEIKTVFYEIQTKKSVEESAEIKIVLISDLHLGAANSERNLAKIVEKINKLQPDIVCIAGDIFNDDFNTILDPTGAIKAFRNIKTNYGVYACLGNHDGDFGNNFSKMLDFLEQSDIKLLNDEHIIIDGRFVLIGRIDASPIGGFDGLKRKNIADILSSIDNENLPIVVMDHNPAHIEEYGENVDLILSGHTHRGQIFPANLITRLIYIVDYGHYRKNENSPHVIVTSGVGTWGMPMRVGTNSEIVSVVWRF